MIKVALADDHPLFREGVRKALSMAPDISLVGEAADGEAALSAVLLLHPDVVLLDVQLPGLDGIAVARLIALPPDAPRVVLISSRDEAVYGSRIAASGAKAFIAKQDLSGAVLTAALA